MSKVNQLAFPLTLAVVAPLLVLIGLLRTHDVWLTILLYQVVACLLLPRVESWRKRLNWSEHAQILGLSNRIPYSAWILGLVTAAITAAYIKFSQGQAGAPNQVAEALANWGVEPRNLAQLKLVMIVVNAPAEELFWRGYLPGRVEQVFTATPRVQLLTIMATAILYASYHLVTINNLVADRMIGGVMMAGIIGVGLFWGWLRWKTGSVWHALLSHAGAVIAYMALGLN